MPSLAAKFRKLVPDLMEQRELYAAMKESGDRRKIEKWTRELARADRKHATRPEVMDSFQSKKQNGELDLSQHPSWRR